MGPIPGIPDIPADTIDAVSSPGYWAPPLAFLSYKSLSMDARPEN